MTDTTYRAMPDCLARVKLKLTLAPAIIGLILALAGIVLLAGAKPPRSDQAVPAMGHSPASSSPPGA